MKCRRPESRTNVIKIRNVYHIHFPRWHIYIFGPSNSSPRAHFSTQTHAHFYGTMMGKKPVKTTENLSTKLVISYICIRYLFKAAFFLFLFFLKTYRTRKFALRLVGTTHANKSKLFRGFRAGLCLNSQPEREKTRKIVRFAIRVKCETTSYWTKLFGFSRRIFAASPATTAPNHPRNFPLLENREDLFICHGTCSAITNNITTKIRKTFPTRNQ